MRFGPDFDMLCHATPRYALFYFLYGLLTVPLTDQLNDHEDAIGG